MGNLGSGLHLLGRAQICSGDCMLMGNYYLLSPA